MSDSPRAQRYRDQAKKIRGQAAADSSKDIREQLLEVARQYDMLADSAEREWKRWGGD
jgi:hypothetical protein